jgi:hypothetical protein
MIRRPPLKIIGQEKPFKKERVISNSSGGNII